jgi:hypothetical protein
MQNMNLMRLYFRFTNARAREAVGFEGSLGFSFSVLGSRQIVCVFGPSSGSPASHSKVVFPTNLELRFFLHGLVSVVLV